MRAYQRALAAMGVLLVWSGVSVGLAVWFSGRIRDWSVMTDELQYAKLATAIGESGSPLPELHEGSIGVINQLYPLLLAPFYGWLSPPTAFQAAHVVNAVVMASAAVPTYLLGRQVLSRTWSYAVAGLSVLTPWMILSGSLMTEVVAYPAFLWAVLALQLAVVSPSSRRDLLALGAIGLAVLARAQFAVLLLVFPISVFACELSQTLAVGRSRSQGSRVWAALSRVLRGHPLLAALYPLAVVAATMLAVLGSLGGVLGTYSTTVERGFLLPASVWAAAARHLDVVGIGSGLAPLLLGGGWMLAASASPRNRREGALATLFLTTVALLTLEVASYDVRFGSAEVVRDRYLFYIVPLLLVCSASALARASPRLLVPGIFVVVAFFVATVPQLAFREYAGVFLDSPASLVNNYLTRQSGVLGTSTFVSLLGALLGLFLVLALLLVPRKLFAGALVGALLVFSLLTLRDGVDRIVTGTALSGRPLAGPPGRVLDWVDAVLPKGARAAMVPFPVSTAWDTSAFIWWDVEFWNRTITQSYVGRDGTFSYTPFPSRVLAIDWATGEIADTADAPRYVVVSPNDPRFLLVGRPHAQNLGLEVYAVDVPYRVVWASRGLHADGWTRPGHTATVRFFDHGGGQPKLVRVRITLRAPTERPARYRVSGSDGVRESSLPPDGAKAEEVHICIRRSSFSDLRITAWSDAGIEGPSLGPQVGAPRRIGVAVIGIAVRPTRRACASAP